MSDKVFYENVKCAKDFRKDLWIRDAFEWPHDIPWWFNLGYKEIIEEAIDDDSGN